MSTYIRTRILPQTLKTSPLEQEISSATTIFSFHVKQLECLYRYITIYVYNIHHWYYLCQVVFPNLLTHIHSTPQLLNSSQESIAKQKTERKTFKQFMLMHGTRWVPWLNPWLPWLSDDEVSSWWLKSGVQKTSWGKGSSSHYLQGFIAPSKSKRGLFGRISEPSTSSLSIFETWKWLSFCCQVPSMLKHVFFLKEEVAEFVYPPEFETHQFLCAFAERCCFSQSRWIVSCCFLVLSGWKGTANLACLHKRVRFCCSGWCLVANNPRGWGKSPIWVFPIIVVPQNGWFIMENPKTLLKWMIWGYHGNTHFWLRVGSYSDSFPLSLSTSPFLWCFSPRTSRYRSNESIPKSPLGVRYWGPMSPKSQLFVNQLHQNWKNCIKSHPTIR